MRGILLDGVIFDVGDTLIDTKSIIEKALMLAARKLKAEGHIGHVSQFIGAYHRADRNIRGPSVNHLFSGLEIVRRAWNLMGNKESYSAFGIFLTSYRDAVRSNIKSDPELTLTLRQLKRKGVKIGVLSDGTILEQLESLTLLGVMKLVDSVVTSEELGCEKPNSKLFDAILRRLSVKAEKAIMVGNDPYRDILGAKRMGMKTALVTRYSRTKIADYKPRVKPDIWLKTPYDIVRYVTGLG